MRMSAEHTSDLLRVTDCNILVIIFHECDKSAYWLGQIFKLFLVFDHGLDLFIEILHLFEFKIGNGGSSLHQ